MKNIDVRVKAGDHYKLIYFLDSRNLPACIWEPRIATTKLVCFIWRHQSSASWSSDFAIAVAGTSTGVDNSGSGYCQLVLCNSWPLSLFANRVKQIQLSELMME